MKPYYEHAGITIYHGDCEEVIADVETCDIAITSPPYNMGLSPGGGGRGMYRPGGAGSRKGSRFRDGYGIYDDAMPQEEYDKWQRRVIGLLYGSVRLGVFYNHRPRVEHGALRLPLGLDFGGVPLRQIIVWDRGTGIDVNLRHFCTRQEWILLFAKPDFVLVNHSASGMGDVWPLGVETEKHGHPAPFPTSLPSRALRATNAASVLDPFAGAGSTLVAAKDLGRRAIGIEIEERYCEIAAKRLAQEVLFPSAA